jgi:hypothetical protein
MVGLVDIDSRREVGAAPVAEHSTRPNAFVVAAFSALCVVAFFALHTWLSMRGWSQNVDRLRASGARLGHVRHVPLLGSFQGVLADSGGIYFALLLAGVTIGRRGPRFTIAVPLVVWVVGPLLAGWLGGAHGPGQSPVPLPVGLEWSRLSATAGGFGAWLGACVDGALILAPAFALTLLAPPSSEPSSRPPRPTSSDIAAIAFGVFGLLLVVELPRLYGVQTLGFVDDLVPYAAMFAFGAALPRWRWRWPAVVAVPMLATNEFAQWAVWHTPVSLMSVARAVLPYLAATGFGASIKPLIRLFRRLAAHPTEALIACNVLNVTDALLTAIGVHGGIAVESNPLVNAMGLPLKILLVALVSLALARTRPRALVWPCAALAGVVVWHLAGFLAQTSIAWWT